METHIKVHIEAVVQLLIISYDLCQQTAHAFVDIWEISVFLSFLRDFQSCCFNNIRTPFKFEIVWYGSCDIIQSSRTATIWTMRWGNFINCCLQGQEQTLKQVWSPKTVKQIIHTTYQMCCFFMCAAVGSCVQLCWPHCKSSVKVPLKSRVHTFNAIWNYSPGREFRPQFLWRKHK